MGLGLDGINERFRVAQAFVVFTPFTSKAVLINSLTLEMSNSFKGRRKQSNRFLSNMVRY